MKKINTITIMLTLSAMLGCGISAPEQQVTDERAQAVVTVKCQNLTADELAKTVAQAPDNAQQALFQFDGISGGVAIHSGDTMQAIKAAEYELALFLARASGTVPPTNFSSDAVEAFAEHQQGMEARRTRWQNGEVSLLFQGVTFRVSQQDARQIEDVLRSTVDALGHETCEVEVVQ